MEGGRASRGQVEGSDFARISKRSNLEDYPVSAVIDELFSNIGQGKNCYAEVLQCKNQESFGRGKHRLSEVRADILGCARGPLAALATPGKGGQRRPAESARTSENLCLCRIVFFFIGLPQAHRIARAIDADGHAEGAVKAFARLNKHNLERDCAAWLKHPFQIQIDPYMMDCECLRWSREQKKMVVEKVQIPIFLPHEMLWAWCHSGEAQFSRRAFGRGGDKSSIPEYLGFRRACRSQGLNGPRFSTTEDPRQNCF